MREEVKYGRETITGVRRVHVTRGPRSSRPARRRCETRRGTPQTGRVEPESSGTETKEKTESGQAFRFLGPRLRVLTLVDGLFSHLGGDLGPSQTLPTI
jgi:hypothetical protein